MLRCVFICLVIAAAAFTVVVAAANCGWLRLATMVAIGCCCCCCRLVGCLVVVVVVCLVGWLIYALTRIQKAKIYIKMEFHFISAHTERERRQNMFGNISVATATRTKLGTNSQHYIHIESGNQREKERARYIYE